ncbi:MAG: dTDP-4-amino-4,6-dideoxygalactose transaminase [Gammaproteobacteria bacterium]|jgi:dTDP-4-amino-4,6-dideoxygalactose transaminase
MQYKIPFNKPFVVGKELYYIAQTVLGGYTSGDGEYSKNCQRLMQEKFAASQVLLTTSCTSALEMAALLCDIKPGDEVILPSYTFVSTANAFLMRGAHLNFVDIRPDTLNLDESLLEQAVSEKTVAIVPVHYAGVACEMDRIMEIAGRSGAAVIEDAAQGVNARYKSRYLGTIGDMGTYSFHETKNIICGEGGAFVTSHDEFAARAEIIREKGTNRSQFFRGEVDKYTWVDIGSSYLPSDMLAAFLYAQLENMNQITDKRRVLCERYYQRLEPLASRNLIRLPIVGEDCESNYHMFYILVRDNAIRSDLIKYLKQQSILAVFHYIPLHTSPMGQSMGYKKGMFPVTEELSERLLRLPLYYELKEEEIDLVVDSIYTFYSVQNPGV